MSLIQDDRAGQILHFVDFIFEVPQFCPNLSAIADQCSPAQAQICSPPVEILLNQNQCVSHLFFTVRQDLPLRGFASSGRSAPSAGDLVATGKTGCRARAEISKSITVYVTF